MFTLLTLMEAQDSPSTTSACRRYQAKWVVCSSLSSRCLTPPQVLLQLPCRLRSDQPNEISLVRRTKTAQTAILMPFISSSFCNRFKSNQVTISLGHSATTLAQTHRTTTTTAATTMSSWLRARRSSTRPHRERSQSRRCAVPWQRNEWILL